MIRRTLVVATALGLAACQPAEPEERLSLPPHNMQQLAATIAVPADYGTIADALTAAQIGDVVHVDPGTYYEDLTVPGGVILQGSGIFDTIIDGQIAVTGGEAGLVSLGIVGPGAASASTCGVSVGTGDSVEMVSVYVSNYYAGVCLDGGPTAIVTPTVDRASLTNNGYGVLVQSGEAIVTNSYFSYSIRSGIYGYDDATVLATNNTFLGNAFGGDTNDRDAAISLGANGASVVRNNNLVSNHFGVNCEGCLADFDTNNVWGNTTNWAGDVSSNSSTLSMDPIFRNVSAGNFRLSEVSPLIDAGSNTDIPSHDWDGLPRPSGAGADIGADEWSLSEYTIVINEVMANPTIESTGEFVELLNVGQLEQDLAGIILSDGDQDDVIQGYNNGPTLVPAGGIAVIIDPGYAGQYTIDPNAILLTTGNATLGNGLSTNDPIIVREPSGYVTIDEWTIPFNPGDGESIERIDTTIGNVSSNWVVNLCTGGNSIGAPNCAAGNVTPNDPSTLVITEVMANPLDEQSGEYIELWNSGTEPVDLSSLWIREISSSTGNTSDDDLISFAGSDTVLPPGGVALILDPGNENQYREPITTILMTTTDQTIGNGLQPSNDSVELWDGDPDAGGTLVDAFSWPTDPGNGVSIEKVDYLGGDVDTNWTASTCSSGHSSGRLNCNSGGVGTTLVVNEVLNNPLDETSGEFVELFNYGGSDIELANLWISDGDQTEPLLAYQSGPTVLPSGGFALIIDSGFDADFDIPAGTILLTTGDAHIGNGLAVTDPIALYEFDGTTTIDTWNVPFNPGNGTSAEKVAHLVNDYVSNWDAADCAAGSSPGLANCVSYTPIPAGTTDLWISEVMSNPLDEGTGEFIEIYNHGSEIVDLWGLILYDGDAWDFLREYNNGSTLVYPGEYAVIVDLQYAGQYTIPSGTTVITVDDGAIGSGLATNDPVYLYEFDGYSVIDSYSFPFNAGNGNSVERTVLADGDQELNWNTSSCGNSLGLPNCGP